MDMMEKKNYDLTQITQMLLEMRDNCVTKDGDAYDDPKRMEKYDALKAAIDLINSPSMSMRWIRAEFAAPGEADAVLVTDGEFIHMAYYANGEWFFCESGQMKEPMFYNVKFWMPLPLLPAP